MRQTNPTLLEINDLMEVLEELEEKKTLHLKELQITDLREISNQQEKIIQKIINAIKNSSIKKIPTEKYSSLLQKYYVNREILLNFKEISGMYFKPFQNQGYKKNGETQKLHLKSVSLTT